MLITCSQYKIVQVISLFRTCLCFDQVSVNIVCHGSTCLHGVLNLQEEAATDPESESELMESKSGEALASKAKALRKAAAKRAARRSSAPEKPKVAEGEEGLKERKWQNFWKSLFLIYSYFLFVFFSVLLSYSVNSLRTELFVK